MEALTEKLSILMKIISYTTPLFLMTYLLDNFSLKVDQKDHTLDGGRLILRKSQVFFSCCLLQPGLLLHTTGHSSTEFPVSESSEKFCTRATRNRELLATFMKINKSKKCCQQI